MWKSFPIFFFIIFIACDKELVEQPYQELLTIPKGFPQPVFPEDNEFSYERWKLGKRLFFDPVLSMDGTISCASCHHPEKAFTDGLKFSEGVEHRLGNRNAPSLANVAYHPYYTREGGVATLEMQILIPIQEHAEFDFNILLIAEKLNEDSAYVQAAYEAYGRAPDPFVITRAISCFERTLISGYSKYDDFLNGNGSALSQREKLGADLFFSDRLACSACHSGFNLTNYAFENNGLYEVYSDPGRFRLTGINADSALFKVPSLRNVNVTSPYMHDGSLDNLEQVVEHYNSGGKGHPHKSPLIKRLFLTEKEKESLVAFLNTLTDHYFINNPDFRQ